MGLLDGKVVVVTGAGRGIGRAIALAAAEVGANVVVNDYGVTIEGREPSSKIADAVVDEIDHGGGTAVASAETVTTMTGGAAVVQAGLDAWGRVDGVVTCAGILRHRPFREVSEEDWDDVVDTHLKGTFTVFRAAAEVMARQDAGGSLVAISSGLVHGDPDRANYRAAKAGVVALMLSVALAGEADGYRANAIAPIADTRMTQQAKVDAPPPEDVAPLAVYLLSDLASRVNGRVISISGDRLAGWSQPTEVHPLHTDGRWTPEGIDRALSWIEE
jgi:NAD(P)-dependent dehydrogenase (short-subunit alcohol dehydrogenase family)